MRLGIAEKTTLLVVAIILTLGVSLGFFFTRREIRSLSTAQSEHARLMAATLANNLQYPMLVRDRSEIKRLVAGVMNHPQVIGCRIIDNTGQLTYEISDGNETTAREFMAAISIEQAPQGADELLLGFSGTSPVEVIGTAVLSVSRLALQQEITRTVYATAIVLLVVIIGTSIVCYLLMKLFLGVPVSMLAEATRKIARGDLEVVVPISRNDEIGDLADAFNTMTAELQNSLVSRDYVDKIIDSIADAVLVVDSSDNITRVNAAAERLFGYSAGKMLQQPLSMLFDSGRSPHDASRRVTRRYGSAEEHVGRTRDGGLLPVVFTSSVMSDSDGKFLAAVCVVTDERERKRAEEEIRKLSTAVEQSTEGIALTDLSGTISYVNNAFAQMHGMQTSRMIGLPMEDLYGPQRGKFRAAFEAVRIAGVWSGEMLPVTADGVAFPTYFSATVLRDYAHTATAVLVHVSDMTHQKELEAQLLQAQKLDSIGQLAGGIAHDFNNMLGAISGYADMILQRFAGDNPTLNKYAGRILDAARRSAELTTKLLAFARKAATEMAPVDAHVVIADVIALLEHTIDRRIHIVRKLDAPAATVLADRTQLQNAVLNLAVNARDAMPEGGEMIFETSVVSTREVPWRGQIPARGQQRYLRIGVIDTGTGMDEHTLGRLFEPFFTTKQLGKGTGLGLASVYGTVQTHKGVVDVRSQEGAGTQFDLYLPCYDVPGDAPGADAHGAGMQSGRETLLLVDDETLVREMARDMLTHLGYNVIVCNDGEEAKEYYRTNHHHIDLVVLDMVMPQLGGYQCFAVLRHIDPAVRVLISSGYAVNDEVKKMLDDGARGFIQKPFEMETLGKAVREALQG